MSDKASGRIFDCAVLLLAVVACAACLGGRLRSDPFYESFYEKAHLIMTQEEKKIYLALKEPEAIEDFIREFWEIRDPDPATEENEIRMEFEERIDFANRWLGDNRTSELKPEKDWRLDSSRGWATDRGRVYIVLGPPDYISSDEAGLMALNPNYINRGIRQTWYYNRFDLAVGFSRDSFGAWIMGLSAHVMQAMRDARLEMVSPSYREELSRAFRFRADWEGEGIRLTIPAERVKFGDSSGLLEALIGIEIFVYRNDEKVDKLEFTRSILFTEEEAEYLNNIEVNIPYFPRRRGKYLFDVIATDLKSFNQARYRGFVKKKF